MKAGLTQRLLGVLRQPRTALMGMYLLGIIHWVCFFYLVFPPGGERELVRRAGSPTSLFERREFTAHDWYKELQYERVVQEALHTGQVPYHMTGLGQIVNSVKNRFLGVPIWTMSPQVALLYSLDPFDFAVVNLLLMYTVGFYGCQLLRREHKLDTIPFTFLFLIFNFNGYFVSKTSAYGPAQYGYFLLPFLVLFIFKVARIPPREHVRQSVALSLLIGLVLAAICYQGSLHLFVQCVTLVSIWGIANYRHWVILVISLSAAFAMSAVRLLPAAVSFGTGGNPHGNVGYPQPEFLLEALTLTRTQLRLPVFTWWEFDMYVSAIGLGIIVYFALWAPFMRFEWVRFKGWTYVAVPCAYLFIASFRQLKHYLIPNWIPLLNAESVTARYMIIPLILVTVIAAINLQGFVDRYWSVRRVRILLVMLLGIMSLLFFNHSRLWRMHRVQYEYDVITSQRLYGEQPPPELSTANLIQNDTTDSLYIMSVWTGFGVSVLAFAACAGWWIRFGKHAKLGFHGQFAETGTPYESPS